MIARSGSVERRASSAPLPNSLGATVKDQLGRVPNLRKTIFQSHNWGAKIELGTPFCAGSLRACELMVAELLILHVPVQHI